MRLDACISLLKKLTDYPQDKVSQLLTDDGQKLWLNSIYTLSKYVYQLTDEEATSRVNEMLLLRGMEEHSSYVNKPISSAKKLEAAMYEQIAIKNKRSKGYNKAKQLFRLTLTRREMNDNYRGGNDVVEKKCLKLAHDVEIFNYLYPRYIKQGLHLTSDDYVAVNLSKPAVYAIFHILDEVMFQDSGHYLFHYESKNQKYESLGDRDHFKAMLVSYTETAIEANVLRANNSLGKFTYEQSFVRQYLQFDPTVLAGHDRKKDKQRMHGLLHHAADVDEYLWQKIRQVNKPKLVQRPALDLSDSVYPPEVVEMLKAQEVPVADRPGYVWVEDAARRGNGKLTIGQTQKFAILWALHLKSGLSNDSLEELISTLNQQGLQEIIDEIEDLDDEY